MQSSESLMSYQSVCLVAVCGAAGCVARLLVSIAARHWLGEPYPAATCIVNLLGCTLFGLCWGLHNGTWSKAAEMAVFVGFFGGFTTFSSFAFESFELLQAGRWWGACFLVLSQNLLGIGGLALGMKLGRSL
jgi:CrcB protein